MSEGIHMIKQLIVIGLGCAIGGMSRYGLSEGLHHWLGRSFPWGTLCVNLLGSLLMGIGFIILVERPLFNVGLSQHLRLFLLVGLLGGFTTFSTFSIDTIHLLENGHLLISSLYIIISVILCVLAAYTGLTLTRLIY